MGLTVRLQGEPGDVLGQVEDPTNVLHRLLPSAEDGKSICLRYIDWYGDTAFNRLQMEPFLQEWTQILSRAHDDKERQIVERVRVLAERCRDEPHLHLRFIGD